MVLWVSFLILSGSYQTLPWSTILATVGVILSAVYMLWLVERVFFGSVKNEALKGLKDLNWRETLCLVPLLILIVWMGVKPNFFLRKIDLASQSLVTRIESRTQGLAMTQKDVP